MHMYACMHARAHTHTHTHTNEILLCCTISATGVVAGEQPQPSRPRMIGLGGEIVSKYWFSDMVLSHCQKSKYKPSYYKSAYINPVAMKDLIIH